MDPEPVDITLKDADAYIENMMNVLDIISEATGSIDYPSSENFPLTISGPRLDEASISRLRKFNGVTVQGHQWEDE